MMERDIYIYMMERDEIKVIEIIYINNHHKIMPKKGLQREVPAVQDLAKTWARLIHVSWNIDAPEMQQQHEIFHELSASYFRCSPLLTSPLESPPAEECLPLLQAISNSLHGREGYHANYDALQRVQNSLLHIPEVRCVCSFGHILDAMLHLEHATLASFMQATSCLKMRIAATHVRSNIRCSRRN